jgi:hypothetical protein
MSGGGDDGDADDVPWEGQAMTAAFAFANACADLARRGPYNKGAALEWVMACLMTEFWDRGFSQTEIRSAFEQALVDMPGYAAGEERRGGG